MAIFKATSFEVICPYCKNSEAVVTLDLNDLDRCQCSECDQTFTPAEALALAAAELARWEAVCRWVEMAREMAAAK